MFSPGVPNLPLPSPPPKARFVSRDVGGGGGGGGGGQCQILHTYCVFTHIFKLSTVYHTHIAVCNTHTAINVPELVSPTGNIPVQVESSYLYRRGAPWRSGSDSAARLKGLLG